MNFCSNCGTKRSVYPYEEKHLQCTECKQIFWINPRPVAVGIVTHCEWYAYSNFDGDYIPHVLLARRTIDPGNGMLALPGGFVEPGEAPHLAARREVLEEIGIDVDFPETPRWVIHSPKRDTILLFYVKEVPADVFSAAVPLQETSEVLKVKQKDAALMATKGEIAFPLHSRVLIEMAL